MKGNKIDYNRETETLTIELDNGLKFQYFNISPDIYEETINNEYKSTTVKGEFIEVEFEINKKWKKTKSQSLISFAEN